MDRRTLILAGAAGAVTAPLLAKESDHAPQRPAPSALRRAKPEDTIRIWPDSPPGPARQAVKPRAVPPGLINGIEVATLTAFRPIKPDGRAVILCPGGGYWGIGRPEQDTVVQRLAEDGITAFFLSYRLPGEGWAEPWNVPLQDAQRAVRHVRHHARQFQIDPAKVGVLGGSAGGHLAGTLATCFDEATYSPIDEIDRQSARPAFAGMLSPVITMRPPHAFRPSVQVLLGQSPDETRVRSRSVELRVTDQTPPCFIAVGLNDKLVSPDNSLLMLAALREKKIPCEAHFFQDAPHGFDATGPKAHALWPDLFLRWVRQIV